MRKTLSITFLLISLILTGHAQNELYNDGALLHANQGGLIHVEGEIQNAAASTLENDGVIELMGNFTNSASASMLNGADSTSTERVFKFIGGGTQLISGNISNSSLRYFYNLVIDKAAPGSAVRLQTNINVTGSLVFGSTTHGSATYTPTVVSTLTCNSNQGIIKTYDASNTDYELYITNPATNAIAGFAPLTINGAPTDAYIQTRGAQGIGLGGLSRNVSATNTAYIFPVGSATNGYNATAITFKSLAANPDKVQGMFVDATGGIGSLSQYCSGCGAYTPGNNGFNYYFNSNPCNTNAPQWIILDDLPQDHGYWSFAGNAGDVYAIESYPNSFTAFGNPGLDNWRLIKKTGSISATPSGDWTTEILSDISLNSDLLTYTTSTNCYAGSGIPGGIYTGFGHYQMARDQFNNALPVELIYLTAQPVENKLIALNWATATESNNAGFEVLRSTDAVNFKKIGWIDAFGNGNSTTEQRYAFNDNTANAAVLYYYKLNQIDRNQAATESYVVDAQLSANSTITVSECFPNPATDYSHIMVNSDASERLEMELYDVAGRVIQHKGIELSAGSNKLQLQTSTLSQGLYKVVIRTTDNIFVRTLNIIN
jgi:hypothetical protein